MRKFALATLVLVAAACRDTAAPSGAVPTDEFAAAPSANSRSIPGQYIVVFRESATDPRALAAQLA
jgi:hypothetical protein